MLILNLFNINFSLFVKDYPRLHTTFNLDSLIKCQFFSTKPCLDIQLHFFRHFFYFRKIEKFAENG
jgi:hypothetical protein